MQNSPSNPQIEKWQQELDSIGRVEIKSDFSGLTWRVGLAFALAAGVIYMRYLAGDLGQRGLTYAFAGLALLIAVLVVAVRMYWGGKAILIERDSIVTMEGVRIPWTDITDVSVFTLHRSGPALQVNLTESAWSNFLLNQGRGGRFLHRANNVVTRNRGLVMSQYLEGQVEDLAAWMNQHVRGKHSESS